MPKPSHYNISQLLIRTLSIAVIAVTIAGCGKHQVGGGTRGIVVSGNAAKEAVYGIKESKELGFVVFTDFPSEGTVTSAGSTWTGQIVPQIGNTIEYQGSENGLVINGAEFNFEKGRVFLVSNKQKTSQLSIPIREADYAAEIDRIAKNEDVQSFLTK